MVKSVLMVRFLLVACTVISLALLTLGEIYKGNGNDDPRLYFGRWALIFHQHDEIVITHPARPPESIDYGPIRLAEIGCFAVSFLSLLVIAARARDRDDAASKRSTTGSE